MNMVMFGFLSWAGFLSLSAATDGFYHFAGAGIFICCFIGFQISFERAVDKVVKKRDMWEKAVEYGVPVLAGVFAILFFSFLIIGVWANGEVSFLSFLSVFWLCFGCVWLCLADIFNTGKDYMEIHRCIDGVCSIRGIHRDEHLWGVDHDEYLQAF